MLNFHNANPAELLLLLVKIFVCTYLSEYLCIINKDQSKFDMKRKEDKKISKNEAGNFENQELELKLMENELFGWLISSAYQSYGPDDIQRKTEKNKNNNFKKKSIKKTKRSLK